MASFDRLEIWGDIQAASGVRLAVIPDVIALTETRRLLGDEMVVATLPALSPAYASLLELRVLRAVYTDDSFDEWRITEIGETHDRSGLVTLVTAQSILIDLARSLCRRTEADGTIFHDFEGLQLVPGDHVVAYLLQSLYFDLMTWFTAPVVQPTAPVDLVYAWDSVLAQCQRLADVTHSEFYLTRNGTTGYFLNWSFVRNGGLAPVTISLGKNLQGVKRQRSAVEQSTRLYVRGQEVDSIHGTLAHARWKISAIASLDVTLVDPAGGDGPAQFASQLNGWYLRTKTGGLVALISVTTVLSSTDTKVTVASTAGLAVNDVIELRLDNVGTELSYLDDAASKATYGLKIAMLDRPDIADTVNEVVNPSMRLWAGASSVPADNWTKVLAPTVTKTTTSGRWRTGGQSCRVQSTGDGQGIEANYVTVVPSSQKPFFSGFVSFWIETGQVRVEMVATDGVTTWIIPDGTEGRAWSNEVKVWIDLGVAGIDLKALGTGVTQVKLRIVQDGTVSSDFYVDSAQIVQESSQRPFTDGSGPNRLWQEANERLLLYGRPLVRVDVDVLDLTRLDATAWPYDDLQIGGTVNIDDAELNVSVSTRVIEITRDLLHAAATRVVLSNRPEDLTDALVRPKRPDRLPRDADTQKDPTVEFFSEPLATTPMTVKVRLGARPENASIRYKVLGRVLGLSEATPPIGHSSYILYSDAFTVTLLDSIGVPTDRVVVAYAQLGGRYSAIGSYVIPKAIPPVVTVLLSEATAGTLTIQWTLAGEVREVAVYRGKNLAGSGWPTSDNSLTGTLDQTKFLGRFRPTPDGGGWDVAGVPVPGRLVTTEAGYVNNDVAKVIVLGLDNNGNVTDRGSASITMTNTAGPALTSFTSARQVDGTACSGSSAAKNRVSWTNNAQVLSTDHLKIWQNVNGEGEVLVYDQDNPTSPLFKDVLQLTRLGAGPQWYWVYRYELSRSAVLKDSGQTNLNWQTDASCPQ